MSLHLGFQNNRLFYDTETVSCRPVTDGKDGNGLKLEKIGPIFPRSVTLSSKVTGNFYG